MALASKLWRWTGVRRKLRRSDSRKINVNKTIFKNKNSLFCENVKKYKVKFFVGSTDAYIPNS